jgi:DNA-directed RNA polymerase subunit RPC12/RpoP
MGAGTRDVADPHPSDEETTIRSTVRAARGTATRGSGPRTGTAQRPAASAPDNAETEKTEGDPSLPAFRLVIAIVDTGAIALCRRPFAPVQCPEVDSVFSTDRRAAIIAGWPLLGGSVRDMGRSSEHQVSISHHCEYCGADNRLTLHSVSRGEVVSCSACGHRLGTLGQLLDGTTDGGAISTRPGNFGIGTR